MNKLNRIKELVQILNKACDSYYNTGKELISDFEYDKLFDELVDLEKETKFIMSNSPTQRAGYTVQDKLKKSIHKYPMLSLDKTKSVDDLISFVGNKKALLMFKMDGLTCAATYDTDGNLILCETRGNGIEGSDITENAKTFVNLPKRINHKGGLVVFGEAIIDYPTFYVVNEKMADGNKYKNPRNLCAGTVQVLDSKICAERNVKFIAWRLVEGYDNNSFTKRLGYLQELGFEVVPGVEFEYDKNKLESQLEQAKIVANKMGYGIDGVVCSFDDVKYIESLGSTSHHMRGQIAFKYFEDREFSTLREIEWSPSRTGQLNPVAIFDPIELAGTEVSRASLSNISVMKQYNIKIGAQVEVCKRNEIIPKIESCDGNGEDVIIPDKCPICGKPTEIKISEDRVEVLVCTSEFCPAKLLGKLELFCSKEGLDIDGISEATLKVFIDKGWLKDISDIYKIKEYKKEMINLPGFGIKSVNKLLAAIEDSRAVSMSNFIRSLGIPLIGKTASKDLAKHYNNDINRFEEDVFSRIDFSEKIEGFGDKMNQSIHDWFNNQDNKLIYNKLKKEVTFINVSNFDKHMNKPEDNSNYKNLSGKTFVITGSLNHFENRDMLKNLLESLGAKVSGSVSKKTTALINNDVDSTSSKNKKAKDLNIPIWSEGMLLDYIKGV